MVCGVLRFVVLGPDRLYRYPSALLHSNNVHITTTKQNKTCAFSMGYILDRWCSCMTRVTQYPPRYMSLASLILLINWPDASEANRKYIRENKSNESLWIRGSICSTDAWVMNQPRKPLMAAIWSVGETIPRTCQEIDLIHKSQNASVSYPTMFYSEQKCAHFCSERNIVVYGTGAFWDLWNWSIETS